MEQDKSKHKPTAIRRDRPETTHQTGRGIRVSSRLALLMLILAACIGCDRVTKRFATETLSTAEVISFLGDSVRIQYAENPGAFLGLGGKLPPQARFWLITVLNILFLAIVTGVLVVHWNMPLAWFASLALLLAGGIGNLIDRLFRDGLVVDFINLGIGPIRTGIFNVADVAITVGTISLFFLFSKSERKKPESIRTAGSSSIA